MAQILGMLSKHFHPIPVKSEPVPLQAKPDKLEKFSFHVCAVDGSAFTMDVLAPNAEVASRFVKRYPGILSFDPVQPEGSA